jgi:hypothetical protein
MVSDGNGDSYWTQDCSQERALCPCSDTAWEAEVPGDGLVSLGEDTEGRTAWVLVLLPTFTMSVEKEEEGSRKI